MNDINTALKLTAESVVEATAHLTPADRKEYDYGMGYLLGAVKGVFERLYPEFQVGDSADWWKET